MVHVGSVARQRRTAPTGRGRNTLGPMSQGALVRLYRPGFAPARWPFGWYVSYEVVIDGAVVGDLWGREVKAFEVSPGQREVELKRPPFPWSTGITIAVQAGATVDLATSLWFDLLGFPQIHMATPRQKARVEARVNRLPPGFPGER